MFSRTYLALALATSLAAPSVALAQDADVAEDIDAPKSEDLSSNVTQIKAVKVTGSHLSTSELEGASQVITITAEEIEKQGFSTVRDALMTVSQSTGNVDTDMDQTGGTPNGQFVNLRGLGPQYTLVLLNGKRMANYPQAYDFRSSAVSLSSIPVTAIERIEVLSGGASAIYGSDAVAGVINVITKTNYDGDELRVRGGTTTRGGGNSILLQWAGGKSGDNWNITYAAQYQKRKPILAHQRDFMASSRNNPAYRDAPSEAPAPDAVYLDQVDGAGYLWPDENGNLSTSTGALTSACSGTNPSYETYRSSPDATNPDRCGDYAYSSQRTIQNGMNQISGLLSGTYDLSSSTNAYYTVLASRSDDRAYNSTMYHFYMSPDNVYDPELGVTSLRRRITPAEVGGHAPHKYDERAYSFNAGIRGTAFDSRFDWDVSFGQSGYEVSIDRRNFVTSRVRDYFLGDLQGYTSDDLEIRNVRVDRLFSPMDPSAYDSISTVFTNRGESTTSNVQSVVTGDLFDIPAGTVRMAAVLEAAHEQFKLLPDERTTPDYTGNERIFNWTAVDTGGSRTRYALGVEAEIPILSTLSATVAGRYDKYADKSDVGGALTWQGGLEWRPTTSLLMRSSYATSFRAPDMTYLFTGLSSNFYWLNDVYQCRIAGLDPNSPECTSGSSEYRTQVEGTYKGNLDLKEEKGKSLTAGFVWDISDSMSISADFYRIELENAVDEVDRTFAMHRDADCLIGKTVSGETVDTNSPSCDLYTSAVERNDDPNEDPDITGYSSSPMNQSTMRTEGLDISAQYRFQAGALGNFGLSVGYTLVTKLESQLFPGDAFVNERDNRQYTNFRSKANWQVNWENGDDWAGSLYGYRWGSLPNYAETGRTAPYIVWNARVSKSISKAMTVGLSVNNLFNKIHPRDDTHTTYPYFRNSYSPVGRELFAELSYNF